MRSRPARWLVCAVAVLALAASGYFVFHSEKEIAARRSALRSFEGSARDASTALADLRAGQQAYVAAGQGVAFWMPRVEALLESAEQSVDVLRGAATDANARAALMKAAASIAEFRNADTRARDYLKTNQALMAADVVFTEGVETATTASKQVDASAVAERLAFDQFEALQSKSELYGAAAGGGVAVLALILLAPIRRGATDLLADVQESSRVQDGLMLGSMRVDAPLQAVAPPAVDAPRESVPALKLAAAMCTDFGRARNLDDLTQLLARAADALEASGVVVWLGAPGGGDLRPVIAHGYAPQLVAKMPTIPRSADNAAAAAYRTGALQIVLARPGKAAGALVAPLLAQDGCIGALTAEIKGGAESSDAVQALAAIFAAQLAGVLGPAAQADTVESTPRAAQA